MASNLGRPAPTRLADAKLVSSHSRLPSTVHRWPSLYPVGGSPILPRTGRPTARRSIRSSVVQCPRAIPNHLSQSINHDQEPLVRGQQIGLGSSYEGLRIKRSRARAAVYRPPLAVVVSSGRLADLCFAGASRAPRPAFSFVETPGSPPAEFGTGVADVAGLCRHHNHLSQSINHHQEPLVRGQQIGLGSSYEAWGSKDRELVQPSTVCRFPSTVFRP